MSHTRTRPPLSALIVALIFTMTVAWLYELSSSMTDTNHETGGSVVVGRR